MAWAMNQQRQQQRTWLGSHRRGCAGAVHDGSLAADAAAGTVLSCTCGRCSVTFAASRNRLTMECGCIDCYQASEWAEAMGGPAVPQIPRLSYWANDILATEGEQHMGIFVLRDSPGSAAFQVHSSLPPPPPHTHHSRTHTHTHTLTHTLTHTHTE